MGRGRGSMPSMPGSRTGVHGGLRCDPGVARVERGKVVAKAPARTSCQACLAKKKVCLLAATQMMRAAMKRRQHGLKMQGAEEGEPKPKKARGKGKEDAGEGWKLGEASGSGLGAAEVVIVREASGSQVGVAEEQGSQGEGDFQGRMLQLQQGQVVATEELARQMRRQTELMERLVRAVEDFVGKKQE